MRTRVKICCIGSPAEAALAIRLGADALGLVGHMPSGPGVISDARIAEIQPFGLDLCSGVRTGGYLNPYKLEDFMQAVYR